MVAFKLSSGQAEVVEAKAELLVALSYQGGINVQEVCKV